MNNENNKVGKIVLLIFLLICSGLGISAFVMSFKNCNKDGFECSSGFPDICSDSSQCPPSCPVCSSKGMCI